MLFEDGRSLDVANVLWCSGFHPGFDWIDLPIFGGDGKVGHQGGVVENQPGLYFVGLSFLYAMSSSMIHGVSRDAARIVETVKARIGPTASDRRGVRALAISGTGRRIAAGTANA